jgi:hypothetical protein
MDSRYHPHTQPTHGSPRPSATRSWTWKTPDTSCRSSSSFVTATPNTPELIDKILGTAGIATVLTGVRMPRINSIIERWVKTLRTELLDRALIWNQTQPRRALREYERHYNQHRTHRSLAAAAPLRTLPQSLEPDQIDSVAVSAPERSRRVAPWAGHMAMITSLDVPWRLLVLGGGGLGAIGVDQLSEQGVGGGGEVSQGVVGGRWLDLECALDGPRK